MPLTFEDYKKYYHKNKRFPDGAYVSPKGYNEAQLKSKFKKYIASLNKKQEALKRYIKNAKDKQMHRKTDLKWEVVKQEIDKRDGKKCRLYKILNITEKKQIEKDLIGNGKSLDRAHVFGKGAFPHMKYNSANIVTLYRIFHQRLDTYYHPIFNKPITEEERNEIWIRIIGTENFEKLRKESIHQVDK